MLMRPHLSIGPVCYLLFSRVNVPEASQKVAGWHLSFAERKVTYSLIHLEECLGHPLPYH